MAGPTAKVEATILVVENEPAIRTLIARLLTGLGCTVWQARNGAEAATFAKDYEGPIQLLVTDVLMPGINGFELADSLSQSRQEMRVLFMSGHVEDSPVAHDGYEHHAANFLVKPFTGDVFIRKVREILEVP